MTAARRRAPDVVGVDAALDAALDAHRVALVGCRRCGLPDRGVQPIVSLARTPRVMLVGQAPGRVEAGGGSPFAGRAGRTLFTWLARAGLDEPSVRARVYISAITRCFPGASPTGRGDRVPSPRERGLCDGWLQNELRIIRPRLIVAVGRLAIDRFLGPLALADVVGRVRTAAHEGGESTVIALPHPSGASTWVHAPAHAALLGRALGHLGAECRELGVVSTNRRSVA